MKYLFLVVAIGYAFFNVAQTSVYNSSNLPEKPVYDIAIMNTSSARQAEKFKKVEFGIDLKNSALADDLDSRINWFLEHPNDTTTFGVNPFLEWELDISATLTHVQTGLSKTRSFFYYQEFKRDLNNNDWKDLNPSNNHVMRMRFAAPKAGLWEVSVSIKDHGKLTHTLPSFQFNVQDNNHPGYVKVHENKRNYQRGNEIIYPLGHTFPGPYNGVDVWGWDKKGRSTNKTAKPDDFITYMKDISDYVQAGGKYIKTAQVAYSNLIEFEHLGNYHNRMHYAWEQDLLMDYCEENDVLIDFNLLFQDVFFRYGQSGGPGGEFDGWGNCPGGFNPVPWDYGHEGPQGQPNPCDNTPPYCYYVEGTLPGSMFLDADRMLYHKQRTRYYISRYGYSPQIYMFELMSEPHHMNANLSGEPIADVNHPEHQVSMDAVNAYHNEISDYIKDEMNHKDHLLCMQQYRIDNPELYFTSAENKNIDIIGHNPYISEPDKLVKEKSTRNQNKIERSEVSRFKDIEEFRSRNKVFKPIILTEAGSGIEFNPCSEHSNHYSDVMTYSFAGYAGYHIWNGYQHPLANGKGEPETRFLWASTIRAEKFMNSLDVLKVLSAENGDWTQGRQISKNQLKGMQYFVSGDGSSAVGYVQNRTFNHHTKMIDSNICYNGVYKTFRERKDVTWNDNGSVMKIKGLNQGNRYTTDYVRFLEGEYIDYDCEKPNLFNAFKLKHPDLLMELKSLETNAEEPILWFIIRESDCKKK